MIRRQQDFEPFYEGEDFTQRFVIEDGDGAAKDLTDAAAGFAMARSPDVTPALEKSTGGDIAIADAAAGALDVAFGPETAGKAGEYLYWLKVTDGDGKTRYVCEGKVIIGRAPL